MDMPRVNITIPTLNRARCLDKAIEAALRQSYSDFSLTVIDDGSTDDTWRVLRRYASDPRFAALRLGRNLGTANAKNVGILCGDYDAITFHDSDDIPSEHKLLLQSRAMALERHLADEILDWRAVGREPRSQLPVDVVVGAYRLVKMDGGVHEIRRRISLVDDFFPNIQFPAKTEGDWCLINAGLFHRRVFARLGAFLDSIEEDRELRNRTIAAGCIYYFVEEPLLTKIEMNDSLTIAKDTGFKGEKRRRDREEVWRRNQLYRTGITGREVEKHARVTIDIPTLALEDAINPGLLRLNRDVPATQRTWRALRELEPGTASLAVEALQEEAVQ